MKECGRRRRGETHCSPPSEAIDFRATYALFVCTDTLECKLVKCEVHHLSLAGPRLVLPAAYQHINTHAQTRRAESGHFANQIPISPRPLTRPVVSRSRLWHQAVMVWAQDWWVTGNRLNRVIIHLPSFFFRPSDGFIFILMEHIRGWMASGYRVFFELLKNTSQDLFYRFDI